jgi:hypothetical protein
MPKSKSNPQLAKPSISSGGKADWLARFLAIAGVIISGLSLWQSHLSSDFTYSTSLPAITRRIALAAPMVEEQPLSLTGTIKNSGTTTATHVRHLSYIFTLPLNQKPAFDETRGTLSHLSPNLIPGVEYSVSTTTDLHIRKTDNDSFEQINNGNYGLYVMEKLVYHDIKDKIHTKYFCFSYDRQAKNFVLCKDFEQ